MPSGHADFTDETSTKNIRNLSEMTWDERHNDLRFLGLNVTPHIAQNERRRRAPPSTANPRGTRGLRHQPAETQANRGAIWLEHDHLWLARLTLPGARRLAFKFTLTIAAQKVATL
jgi:hypothetical protein